MLFLAVAMGVIVRTTAVVARHRAESAADLAALAAAAAIGIVPDNNMVCLTAGPIAAANGSRLVSCVPSVAADGRNGTVTVRVVVNTRLPILGTASATATARAGRLPTKTTVRRSGHPL